MHIQRIIFAGLLLVFSVTAALIVHGAQEPLTEKGKIEALIRQVETLRDATFIRNSSEYGAKTAASFLSAKWKAHEKEIKTARDFIEKLASMSSTSGRPYSIRFKGGREVKCGEFLKARLQELEK